VDFSSLTSSWAPFLVAAASLLRPGGRMAFVVPAEIGHAPYAAPLMNFLMRSFRVVRLIAIQESVFQDLSQDIWILSSDGYGDSTDHISFTMWDRFRPVARPPKCDVRISLTDWQKCGHRIRPFLINDRARELYSGLIHSNQAYRLGDAARIGIGYVSGANGFFHLSPSAARLARIPRGYLLPTVRNGRFLPKDFVTADTVLSWKTQDVAYLLLRLQAEDELPTSIMEYLNSEEGRRARQSYKCAHRKPWYVVPDVQIPDGFLSYMSGDGPVLVENLAGCTCTNSVHAVRLRQGFSISDVQSRWRHPLTQLSTEIEGHPLGGGMLKLEPREATRIAIPRPELRLSKSELALLSDARAALRRWRHYD
jgi:hypothetical protein